MVNCNRRKMLNYSLGCVAANLTSCVNRPQSSELNPTNELTKEQWMNECCGKSREAQGVLHLSRFADPIYFLTKPIKWKPNPGQENYREVNVPVGFVTDLASIPNIFFSVLRPDGNYTFPAIVHDYLYWTQERPREEADAIFDLAMRDFEINSATRFIINKPIRIFGSKAWNANEKARLAGEKRILQVFPEDPTMTWKEWKVMDNIFQ